MPTFATVTWKLTQPEEVGDSLAAVLRATPLVRDGLLSLDDRSTFGPAEERILPNGTVSLRLPVVADVHWRFEVVVSRREGQVVVPVGDFEVPAGTVDLRTLRVTSPLTVTATRLATVQDLVTRAEAAAQAAEAEADRAASAEGADLTGYATKTYVQQAITNSGGGTGGSGSGSGLAFDTDGVPYVTADAGTPGSSVALDTDGVPYLTIGA